VIARKRNDFEGIQLGSLRTLAAYFKAWLRCCNSKWRRYFCTMFGIVIRNAAEKF
jgi:hypothetical protein